MIVEIALGIVLAVLILVFLPYIIGLGGIAIGIVLIIASAAAIIYFISTNFGLSFTEASFISVGCLIIVALVVGLIDEELAPKIKSSATELFPGLFQLIGFACLGFGFICLILPVLVPDSYSVKFSLLDAGFIFFGFLFLYVGKKLSKTNVPSSTENKTIP